MGRRSFLVALGVASTRGDQITRSMIAAYTFDDLTAADSGPNGWHGTAANYVPVVTERGDYAMSFGGAVSLIAAMFYFLKQEPAGAEA